VADAIFEDRRLAEIYDPLEGVRPDLDAYLAMVDQFGARSVLDVGCGTGTFACLLARQGLDVTAVDPAAASLDVARRKPRADAVRWLLGDATTLPPLQVDLATMTGNVAQVFLTDQEWTSALRGISAAMWPAGLFIFEIRDPARQAWQEWNRKHTHRTVEIAEIGPVETWTDLTEVSPPFVTFRMTFVFHADGTVLTSDSALRFRSPKEITHSLRANGFIVEDIRDAADRPGLELVFIARQPQSGRNRAHARVSTRLRAPYRSRGTSPNPTS
jgi:ubiquinone/menaquinone biosynthesis C-methylase UbiE